MLEAITVFLGRNLHVRGVGRLMRMVWPCKPNSTRWIQGVRSRSDGMAIEVDTREVIDWEEYFNGGYEPHMAHLFRLLIRAGGVAIDVGANVGAHTLTLAHLVGPSGRVLAFEPNPVVRHKLVANLNLNGLENVSIFDTALGSMNHKLMLRVPKKDSPEASNPGLASIWALDSPHDLVEVIVRPFDDVVEELSLQHIDLVKIDVQGFEEPVLRGMRSSLSRFSPIVVFEYEDWAWSKSNSQWHLVKSLFDSLDYVLWRIGTGRNGLSISPILENIKAITHMEVIALPKIDTRISALRVEKTAAL